MLHGVFGMAPAPMSLQPIASLDVVGCVGSCSPIPLFAPNPNRPQRSGPALGPFLIFDHLASALEERGRMAEVCRPHRICKPHFLCAAERKLTLSISSRKLHLR